MSCFVGFGRFGAASELESSTNLSHTPARLQSYGEVFQLRPIQGVLVEVIPHPLLHRLFPASQVPQGRPVAHALESCSGGYEDFT